MKFKKSSANAVLTLLSLSVLVLSYQNCGGKFEVMKDAGKLSLGSELGDVPPPSNLPNAPVPPVPVAVGGVITTLKIQNTVATEQSTVPFTFGQVFAEGTVPASSQMLGRLSDGSEIPLQVNVKATHADGSLRHAIISGRLPKLAASAELTMSLLRNSAAPGASILKPIDLVNAGFRGQVRILLNGVIYTASADQLLTAATPKTWLSGSAAEEWIVASPLTTATGEKHPHLTARFAIRAFPGLSLAKVDVVVENNWAYEPAPQNFTYDVVVSVGGQAAYSKNALKHLHHARWKKTFWWGAEPQIHIKHNSAYLIASKAVPNYDQTAVVTEAYLNSLKTGFAGPVTEPMGSGIANPYMPATGGRPDIGLLPSWAAAYVLSMDKRAKDVTLAQADLGGSWSSHYRDKITDQPISLVDFPYMTLAGNPGDTENPATKMREYFPVCGGACDNTNVADISHQPNFAYVPYLLTGDHYYLEEVQFWAAYNVFSSNPHYRQFEKGLVAPEQLRGQGWALRIISEAAYIIPDQDRLKSHFIGFINHNLDWYNATYTNNPMANKLGIIINGYSLSYNGGRGTAPWMDDFFTQAVGHAMELGFTKAKPLLAWKAKFQIGRMMAPGFCWIHGSMYSMNVRDSEASPFYENLEQAYKANVTPEMAAMPCAGAQMATSLGLQVGEMTGYSNGTEGYPSNYQPALALSVDSGAPQGADAWKVFMSRTVKPNYGTGPQFGIVPRTLP